LSAGPFSNAGQKEKLMKWRAPHACVLVLSLMAPALVHAQFGDLIKKKAAEALKGKPVPPAPKPGPATVSTSDPKAPEAGAATEPKPPAAATTSEPKAPAAASEAALPARAQTSATVVEVAASLHVLVLLADGSVVALGNNRSGQLGRPKVIRSFLPAERVPLPAKAVQVAAGEDTSFALLDDGTVWAWGRGYYRTLGVDLNGATERHTPEPIPKLQGVTQIVANGNTAMALMADGTVRAWGELPAFLTGGRAVHPGVSQPTPVPGLENLSHITGAPSMGFALTKDGRAIGWGENDRGSLGLGHMTPEPQRPTELPLKDVVSIATVSGATAAVTRDGRVWTWGVNSQAGLGNGLHGDTSDPGQPTPQPVTGITDAVEVKTGSYGRHFIVRRRTSTLIGWGNSDWGQLGAGISGFHQPAPKAIALPGVEAYWLGGNFSFARTKDGTIWFWGEKSGAQGLLGVNGQQRVPAIVPMEKLLPR
jgi:alpha-tubulin suppressor-like RCC1 family protein